MYYPVVPNPYDAHKVELQCSIFLLWLTLSPPCCCCSSQRFDKEIVHILSDEVNRMKSRHSSPSLSQRGEGWVGAWYSASFPSLRGGGVNYKFSGNPGRSGGTAAKKFIPGAGCRVTSLSNLFTNTSVTAVKASNQVTGGNNSMSPRIRNILRCNTRPRTTSKMELSLLFSQ